MEYSRHLSSLTPLVVCTHLECPDPGYGSSQQLGLRQAVGIFSLTASLSSAYGSAISNTLTNVANKDGEDKSWLDNPLFSGGRRLPGRVWK